MQTDEPPDEPPPEPPAHQPMPPTQRNPDLTSRNQTPVRSAEAQKSLPKFDKVNGLSMSGDTSVLGAGDTKNEANELSQPNSNLDEFDSTKSRSLGH